MYLPCDTNARIQNLDFRADAFVFLMSSAAFCTELVVLESTATNYEPGQTIADDDTIEVAEGTEIVLLSEDGIVIAIRGPFSGPLVPLESEDDYDILRTLGVLVGQSEVDNRSIGGVRGTGEDDSIDPARAVADSRGSPWSIHTGMGGVQCLPESNDGAVFWREPADREERLHIRHLASGDAGTIGWEAGRTRVALPDDVSFDFDSVYVLRKDSERRSVALVVRSIPDAVADNGYSTVAWLAARGCTRQARLALSGLE